MTTGPRPDGAIQNLKDFQEQHDADGAHVVVSRQALEEVLAWAADPPDTRTEDEKDYDFDRYRML